jgi:hypothetical protein
VIVTARSLAGLFLALGAVSGCSGGNGGGGVDNDPPKHVTVGGSIVTRRDALFVGLPGVSVSLTPAEGDGLSVLSNPSGLFELEGLREGVYFFEASMDGYEPRQFSVTVDASEQSAFGLVADDDDDGGSTPTYTFLGNVELTETHAVASIAPFGLDAEDTQTLVDGTAGLDIAYDKSADGDIVVTFDRRVS